MVTGISTHGATYVAGATTLTFLSTLAFSLRVYYRHKSEARLGYDDLFIALGLLFNFGMLIEAVLWATHGKMGFTTTELTSEQLQVFLQLFFANQITYSCICPLIKCGILGLYRRMFPPSSNPKLGRVTIMLGSCAVAWGVAVLCISIFQCSPIDGFWNASKNARCLNGEIFFWGNAGSNLVLDICILISPMSTILRIQTTGSTKIRLVGIFALGIFACVAGAMRIVSLRSIEKKDIVYSLPYPATWTFFEPCTGIICACAPLIVPVYTATWSKIRSVWRNLCCIYNATCANLENHLHFHPSHDEKFPEKTRVHWSKYKLGGHHVHNFSELQELSKRGSLEDSFPDFAIMTWQETPKAFGESEFVSTLSLHVASGH